jgi:hypothetical protein
VLWLQDVGWLQKETGVVVVVAVRHGLVVAGIATAAPLAVGRL